MTQCASNRTPVCVHCRIPRSTVFFTTSGSQISTRILFPVLPQYPEKGKTLRLRSIIVLAYPLITFSRCTLCALNAFRNAFTMDRKCESYWAERKTTSEHRYSQCGEPSSLTRSSAIPPRPLPPPLCSSTTIRASLSYSVALSRWLCVRDT